LLTAEQIRLIDKSNMFDVIRDFPAQIEHAVNIGERFRAKLPARRIRNIVVTGLGGSAIGGDILRAYLAEEVDIPIFVNRHYFLPGFVGRNSLVVVSSYSGNTEETIAAYRDAIKKKSMILCVSTGGEIGKIAEQNRHQIIKIPTGYQPRAALGYSFFPILVVLSKIGLTKSKKKEINGVVQLLRKKSIIYSDINSHENRALQLAQQLAGKLPVVYSSSDRFDSVNLRWRCQFAENAKVLAYGNVFPELNHNEIVGWEVLKDLMKQIEVLLLRDKGDHERVQLRMAITKEVIAPYSSRVTEILSDGKFLLGRIFDLIYLGDWCSFYLAISNGVDPTPVRHIDYLKKKLAETSPH
jgi:glucose/mannose-6-phosphate isomerase